MFDAWNVDVFQKMSIDFFKKIAYNNIVSTEKNVVSLIDVLKYASLLFLKEAINGFFFYCILQEFF